MTGELMIIDAIIVICSIVLSAAYFWYAWKMFTDGAISNTTRILMTAIAVLILLIVFVIIIQHLLAVL